MAFTTRGWPLSRRIVGLALLNLTLMAVVLVLLLDSWTGSSMEALLLGPERGQYTVTGTTISNAIGMVRTPEEKADRLAEFAAQYNAIENGLVDDQTAGGGTTLAGGADSTEDDPRDTHFQVGCFVHDDGVVTTEFQNAASQAGGNLGTDLAADVRGTRKRYQVDALVIDKALGQIMTVFYKTRKD